MILLWSLACALPDGPLVQEDGWQSVEDTVFADHDGAPSCAGWWFEEGMLELDTGSCPLLSIGQPALMPIRQGDALHAGLIWGTLRASEPATAHVALAIDGEPIWERHLAIPGPEGAELLTATAARDYPSDASIVWHVHNHGTNQYRLGPLTVQRDP